MYLVLAILHLAALAKGQNVLFAMGGEPVERDVELLSLRSPSLPCPKPPDYPHTIYSGTGAFVENTVMVCGGFDDLTFEYSNQCFVYGFASEDWSRGPRMSGRRLRPSSVALDSDRMWVTGGSQDDGLGPFRSTEIYQNGEFVAGPDLPVPLFDHCMAQINETATFVAGGITDGSVPGFFGYIYDWSSQEWTTLPVMAGPREGPACGVLHTEDGTEIYVAGGNFGTAFDTVEIFNMNSNTWRYGPRLPDAITDATMINHDDTLVFVGGYSYTNGYSNTLYALDSKNGEWVARAEMLQEGRARFVGVVVNDDLVDC